MFPGRDGHPDRSGTPRPRVVRSGSSMTDALMHAYFQSAPYPVPLGSPALQQDLRPRRVSASPWTPVSNVSHPRR